MKTRKSKKVVELQDIKDKRMVNEAVIWEKSLMRFCFPKGFNSYRSEYRETVALAVLGLSLKILKEPENSDVQKENHD